MKILSNFYLSITETDILIDNIPTDIYNTIQIWNKEAVLIHFNQARLFFLKEFNIKIAEFHILQAKNCSKEPIPDENGHYSWERIHTSDNRYSDWVLTDFYPSKIYCSANCACDSANLTRANSAFRVGLIQTLPLTSNLIKLSTF